MPDLKDIKSLLKEAIKALDERTEVNMLFESLKERFGSEKEVKRYLDQAFAAQDFKILKGIIAEIDKGMSPEEREMRVNQHKETIDTFTYNLDNAHNIN